MFKLLGFWHQVEAVTAATGLSIGALAGLALLVYTNPRLLRIAIPAAVVVLIAYGSFIYGNHIGYVDGKAEIQAKWDDEKDRAEKARLAEKARQDQAAAEQRQQDETAARRLEAESAAEDQAIAQAPPSDDGPVPKVLLDSWARERTRRGIK